jgi:hypothetical protein
MTIVTKYDPGQIVSYRSKLGGYKTGIIEKVFTNVYANEKIHVGYFIKGVFREFKEPELKSIQNERPSSR